MELWVILKLEDGIYDLWSHHWYFHNFAPCSSSLYQLVKGCLNLNVRFLSPLCLNILGWNNNRTGNDTLWHVFVLTFIFNNASERIFQLWFFVFEMRKKEFESQALCISLSSTMGSYGLIASTDCCRNAIKDLSVGLTLDSGNVECLYLRGSCYHAIGEYKDAVWGNQFSSFGLKIWNIKIFVCSPDSLPWFSFML